LSNIKSISIIPARGGSKRIPRKNIKDFLGKPIIAYSIDAALKSALFDKVIVSTDDYEIAEISKNYGAEVPFMRSEKNSNDFATTADVLLEVIQNFSNSGFEFDYLCCIYPCAPFITPQKLQDSFNIMLKEKAEGIIPIVKFSYPIQRALRINNLGLLEYIWPENLNKRSQDLETAYHDASQFYWINVKSFNKSKNLITENSLPFILSEMEVQDIDSQMDFRLAEIKYILIKENNNE